MVEVYIGRRVNAKLILLLVTRHVLLNSALHNAIHILAAKRA